MPNLLSLVEAAQLLPNRPSPASVWRWARRGLIAADGSRIRLAHRRLGARIYIAPEDLDRFARELASADLRHFRAVEAPEGGDDAH